MARRKVAKYVFLDLVGGKVIKAQTGWALSDNTIGMVRDAYVEALRESVKPRDAIEEMLVLQAAWTHARLAHLSKLSADQTSTTNVRVVNEACDRAANTFRRQMLALAEYRRPPRSDAFVAIRQANLANQQVVHNAENQKSECANPSNEQGLLPHAPAALPAYPGGTGVAPADGGAGAAVDEQHGTADRSGQGAVEAQRAEARRAERGDAGRAA